MPRTGRNTRRFWTLVETAGEDDCWVWKERTDKDGYGIVYDSEQRKSRRAHRVSYEMHYGPIPEGLLVCHKCDNPPCVNPSHLFLGTAKDNSDDMVRKGRSKVTRGCFKSKLTDEIVLEICKRIDAGDTYDDISRDAGVSKPAISRINTGVVWGWLTGRSIKNKMDANKRKKNYGR